MLLLASVLDQAPWLICPTTKSHQNKTFAILGFKKSGYFNVSLLYACLIFLLSTKPMKPPNFTPLEFAAANEAFVL
jgi:hypothetical protein